MNKKNYDDKVELTPSELQDYLDKKESLLLFDLRLQNVYESGHIRGSVHAVCDTKSKETLMPNIPKNVKVILLDSDGSLSAETTVMMRSFGLDAYYLQGGMENWNGSLLSGNQTTKITPEKLWAKIQKQEVYLLDVRDPDEFSDFKIPGSMNIPLSDMFSEESSSKIPQDKDIVTICPHGNRAMVAAFALARNGINSSVLEGGLAGWSQVLTARKAAESPLVIQVEKIGKGCLSHIIISENEAVVIDPLFPIEKYLDIVEQENAKITKVIDTHQHADHVSSAKQLARVTGAIMYESMLETWDMASSFLEDKQELEFGKSRLHVIHTPGHTPGSLSYLIDKKYVFTGDTLFVESIGRPDLRDKAKEFAENLYDSLHDKLLQLSTETMVFPTHHGMSVDSVNGIYSTTIFKAKEHDVLKLSKEEFIKQVADITVPRPMNYQKIIQINKGTIPLNTSEIPDLELGPNRCSITGA